jgi:hypothetical protein
MFCWRLLDFGLLLEMVENAKITIFLVYLLNAFEFGFEQWETHVTEPRKHQEYLRLLAAHASGCALRAENQIDRQNLTRDIF